MKRVKRRVLGRLTMAQRTSLHIIRTRAHQVRDLGDANGASLAGDILDHVESIHEDHNEAERTRARSGYDYGPVYDNITNRLSKVRLSGMDPAAKEAAIRELLRLKDHIYRQTRMGDRA